MSYRKLNSWLKGQITANKRLQGICIALLLFLMVPARKHSLKAAAQFSGLHASQFSRLLVKHPDLAVISLGNLSKRQAKQFSKILKFLSNNKLPWKIAIIMDSTFQQRSSLHADNVQRFNHGKGFVIGHQWTNIVLVINDRLIPLPPIAFYTKGYCAENNMKYRTENEYVCHYLHNLKIEDYVGPHKRSEVVVLADSGYDDKRIENTIVKRGWKFIIALNKKRSVKSEKQYSTTPKSKYWTHVSEFFKRHRCIPWQTIHIPVNRAGKKRMEFRLRQIIGYLRYVGKAQLICSEFKKKAHGRRKYLACNDLKATARQILIGYRLRWLIEIFHKHIKMFLGFEDVATKSFQSVISYVHWVYCAYILLNSPDLPVVPDTIGSIEERQKYIQNIIALKDKARIHQLLTRFNGVETYKAELRQALEET